MSKSKMDEVLERLDAVEGYLGSGAVFGGRVRFSQTFQEWCWERAASAETLRRVDAILNANAAPDVEEAARVVSADAQFHSTVLETPIGAERVPGGEVE